MFLKLLVKVVFLYWKSRLLANAMVESFIIGGSAGVLQQAAPHFLTCDSTLRNFFLREVHRFCEHLLFCYR